MNNNETKKSHPVAIILKIIFAGLIIYIAVFISLIYTELRNDSSNTATPSAKTDQQEAEEQPSQAVTVPDEPVDISADDDPVLGDAGAPVTIIEFSDFQCPYCEKFFTNTFPQIKSEYIDTGKVKLVFRDFPLDFHENALPAAIAAECADDQGKFWEMHDLIFENQESLSTSSLKNFASQLSLDTATFNSCLDSQKYKDEVEADQTAGSAAGVQGTPAFFVNGRLISGAQPFSVFQQIIDEELAK